MDITNKIDDYILEGDIESLMELAIFMKSYERLDEGKWLKQIPKLLSKLGIKVEREGKGILGTLKDSKKEIREFFWHLLKASRGNEESKTRVKEMSKGKVEKGDIVDVLVKLDAVTLHMISGPLHIMEYLTGWKISGIKKRTETIAARVKGAIESLKTLAQNLKGKEKRKVTNFTAELKRLKAEE